MYFGPTRMPAYSTSAIGISRKIQPIIVTPRCLCVMCPPSQSLFDFLADSLEVDHPAAAWIEIQPDSRRLADQILVGHVTPLAAVQAVVTVVADHQVMTGRNDVEHLVAAVGRDLRRGFIAHPATGLFDDRPAIAGRQRIGIARETEAAPGDQALRATAGHHLVRV